MIMESNYTIRIYYQMQSANRTKVVKGYESFLFFLKVLQGQGKQELFNLYKFYPSPSNSQWEFGTLPSLFWQEAFNIEIKIVL